MNLEQARVEYRFKFNEARRLIEFLDKKATATKVSKLTPKELEKFEKLLDTADVSTLQSFLNRGDFTRLTVTQLRQMVRVVGVKDYLHLTKAELIGELTK